MGSLHEMHKCYVRRKFQHGADERPEGVSETKGDLKCLVDPEVGARQAFAANVGDTRRFECVCALFGSGAPDNVFPPRETHKPKFWYASGFAGGHVAIAKGEGEITFMPQS